MGSLVDLFPAHTRASAGLGSAAKTSNVISDRLRLLASLTSSTHLDEGMPRSRQVLTVEGGTPRADDKPPVPPSKSMIESTVVPDMDDVIVRNPRTSQAFASGETTFTLGHAQISLMGETVNSIANRLRRTRTALGYDEQTDFCAEIGVAKNVYNPFEKAKRRISIDVAIKIRERFVDKGITLDWIYCGDATRISSKLYRDIVKAA